MRNTYLVREEREVEVTLSIRCNKCGLAVGRDPYNRDVFRDHINVDKVWGFYSSKDLVRHKVDICEACWDAWLSTFVIPADIKSTDEPL